MYKTGGGQLQPITEETEENNLSQLEGDVGQILNEMLSFFHSFPGFEDCVEEDARELMESDVGAMRFN